MVMLQFHILINEQYRENQNISERNPKSFFGEKIRFNYSRIKKSYKKISKYIHIL